VKAFLKIVWLELVAVWRSGTFAMLAMASVGWMLAFPYIVKGDGTAAGAREMYVRYSMGGVFLLLVVCLLGAATGALARERAAKRLQLTMVRPVRLFVIALGKMVALVTVGAVILGLAATILCLRVDLSSRCNHVLSPVMPSPLEEAEAMYDAYMKDPETPDAVKKTRKSIVMRILAQRAVDHYQTIPTNAHTSWTFDLSGMPTVCEGLKVRMRFTNQFEMRQDVLGQFRLGALTGPVSNITQAVLMVPLNGKGTPSVEAVSSDKLVFENGGRHALMLRPRKDLSLLVPADSFLANLFRTYLGLLAVLSLVVACGMFLSASLSRPVALFVALVVLAVSEMSPSVIEQYPDSLETDRLDRIGLVITRCAAELTHPVSALSPLEALSKDECVEIRMIVRIMVLNLIVIPILLAFLSAVVLPRKQDEL